MILISKICFNQTHSYLSVVYRILISYFQGGWIVRALNSSTTFEGVDLGEGDWADYDEKSGESVAIYETKHQFVKAK